LKKYFFDMERIPLTKLLNPLRPFRSLWASRELLMQVVQRDIQSRYRASMFGLFWMLATPLFMLAVYTFVFSVIFQARWDDSLGDSKAAFALIIFCGFSIFNIFAEGISASCTAITGNKNFVKKVVFPLEILPIVSVLTSAVLGLVSLLILFFGILTVTHKLSLTMTCLPAILVPLLLLSMGLAWFLASLGTFVRDLQHAVSIILRMMFFMTPIFYSIDRIPESLRPILKLNPLAGLVEQTRNILLFGQWPNWSALGTLTLVSFFIFHAGYIWFMKTKRGFADVL
jgi:lipopolysaccharide transport system permease protein